MRERPGRPKLTPTNKLSFGLFFAGIALFLASGFVDARPGLLPGVALLLIAASLFVEALLPGGQELSDEQVVTLRHLGIPYRRGVEKLLNGAVGAAALTGALYLLV